MHATLDIRLISPQDLAVLGLDDVAYVRLVTTPDGVTHAIHAADGTEIAIISGSRELAFAAIRQNGLEPVSAH